MQKCLICMVVISVVGYIVSGCESEGQNALKLACEGSELVRDKSVCENITAFGLSCIESGGTVNLDIPGNNCKCSNINCAVGAICGNDGNCNLASESLRNCDVENAKRCNIIGEDSIVQQCKNGVWKEIENCGGNSCTGIASEIQCGECKNLDIKCEDGKIITCKSGNWGVSDTCPSGMCAFSGNRCADCRPGDKISNECHDNSETKIGQIPVCTANGEWDKENCANNASCTTVGTCGKCQNGSIQCANEDGKGTINYCLYGNLKSDWEYTEERVNDILVKYDSNKWTINENRQCEVYNQPNYFPKKLQCNSDYSACADCNDGDKLCSNIDSIGSELYMCNYGRWENIANHTKDNNTAVSCNAEFNDFGECLNGQYRISVTKHYGCNKLGIDACSSGTYNKTHQYEHAIRCNDEYNNLISLYSVYTDDINFHLNDDVMINNQTKPFECGLLLNNNVDIDATFDMNSCIGNKSIFSACQGRCFGTDSFSSSGVTSFIDYYYGIQSSSRAEWFYYLDSDVGRYKWFNCSETECNKISFCVDSVAVDQGQTDGDITYYLGEQSLILSFDISDSEHLKLNFKSAPDGCNSNRTDNSYDYDDLTECSEYAIGASVKYDPNDLSELKFRVCRYKSIREVSCSNLFEEGFLCSFTYVNELWRDSTICLDFYNKSNFEHKSYKLWPRGYGSTMTGDASIKDNTIIECSNGCNEDWTDCAE